MKSILPIVVVDWAKQWLQHCIDNVDGQIAERDVQIAALTDERKDLADSRDRLKTSLAELDHKFAQMHVAKPAMPGQIKAAADRFARFEARDKRMKKGANSRRKGMTTAARKALSERMKKYWAERRKAKAKK